MCLSIESLGGNLSILNLSLTPPALNTLHGSFRTISPSHLILHIYSVSCIHLSLCTVSTVLRPALHGVRSITMRWVDSPLGATGSVCEGRGTLFWGLGMLGGGICPTFRAWSDMLQKAPPLTDKHTGNTPEKL